MTPRARGAQDPGCASGDPGSGCQPAEGLDRDAELIGRVPGRVQHRQAPARQRLDVALWILEPSADAGAVVNDRPRTVLVPRGAPEPVLLQAPGLAAARRALLASRPRRRSSARGAAAADTSSDPIQDAPHQRS